ncbi:hypothetical protein Golob_022940 [Gossypium lobatum]|uniref:RNase H type-1 domain-containing protein n=1 Tax=Gossypium lobatum TaxID=34289 RepID=A0A7J8LI31_9ROSI|nr:hypothetical protein [Gossypium lobatum]
MLQEGTCWRVEKGDNVSIFNHAWLPGFDNYGISHPVDNCNLKYFVELIDNNKREWREEIISNTFDAERILRITLAAISYEDDLAWRGEPSGVSSVHSAYKLLQMGIPTPTLNTLQLSSRDFYRTLWNLKLLPKVQITAIIKETWVPSSREDIKINFDADFNKDFFRVGLGVVAQDGRGKVIASKATIHENVGSTFAAKSKFRLLNFQHVRHKVNNLADTIATKSLKKREEFYLEGSVPIYAVKALEDDWIREPD